MKVHTDTLSVHIHSALPTPEPSPSAALTPAHAYTLNVAKQEHCIVVHPVHSTHTSHNTHTAHSPSSRLSKLQSQLLSLSPLPPHWLTLLFCFAGLHLSQYYWISLDTFTYDERPAVYTQFLVLLNRVFGLSFALVALFAVRRFSNSSNSAHDADSHSHSPFTTSSCPTPVPSVNYFTCSAANIISTFCQFEALKYVSFPLQVLAKSSKMLLTMSMSRVLNGSTYPLRHYAMAVTVALGLLCYRLSELENGWTSVLSGSLFGSVSTLDEDDETWQNLTAVIGMILLAVYMLSDSFTATMQSTMFQQYSVSVLEMMVGMNFVSGAISLFYLLISNKLITALEFAVNSPAFLQHALVLSVVGCIGQLFMYYTIQEFGAVTYATLVTARQVLSLLLALISFAQPVNLYGVLGLLLVFTALGMKLLEDMTRHQTRGRSESGHEMKKIHL